MKMSLHFGLKDFDGFILVIVAVCPVTFPSYAFQQGIWVVGEGTGMHFCHP